MKTYRLYLGHYEREIRIPQFRIDTWFREVVDPLFDAYTLIKIDGVWKGIREPSTILEVVGDAVLRASIEAIADSYVRRFRQDAVLVTASDTEFELIERERVAA